VPQLNFFLNFDKDSLGILIIKCKNNEIALKKDAKNK